MLRAEFNIRGSMNREVLEHIGREAPPAELGMHIRYAAEWQRM